MTFFKISLEISLETFLIRIYFYNNAKKTGTNFDLTTDFSIEKYQTISIKFKIRISQFISKIEHKQQSLNQARHRLTGHIQM